MDWAEYHRKYDIYRRSMGMRFHPARYRIEDSNGTTVKFFRNRDKLSEFLGYSPSHVSRFVDKDKELCGYRIFKIKWWESDVIIYGEGAGK